MRKRREVGGGGDSTCCAQPPCHSKSTAVDLTFAPASDGLCAEAAGWQVRRQACRQLGVLISRRVSFHLNTGDSFLFQRQV